MPAAAEPDVAVVRPADNVMVVVPVASSMMFMMPMMMLAAMMPAPMMTSTVMTSPTVVTVMASTVMASTAVVTVMASALRIRRSDKSNSERSGDRQN